MKTPRSGWWQRRPGRDTIARARHAGQAASAQAPNVAGIALRRRRRMMTQPMPPTSGQQHEEPDRDRPAGRGDECRRRHADHETEREVAADEHGIAGHQPGPE